MQLYKQFRADTEKGFTLIELLVVIAIIGLLSSIVLASLQVARVKARDARRLSDLMQMKNALELYYNDNRVYPFPPTNNIASCTGTGDGGSWSSWVCWNTLLPAKYIPTVPSDPSNVDLGSCSTGAGCHVYEYCRLASGQSYVLAVNLERAPSMTFGDPTSVGCPNGGPNWYWIKS